ncbi:hypothetical protein SB49_03650 [Sediminicola sp. YIK13]|uniref:hypothetical protein n=1 Tax=Sediminicola sp. YIK13 TaxID=1453352 RepID=UPI0007225EF7|nr:hypothetical protein [Sediminicola sp. YIK13]ALM06996.1 hypothetical protein SB49_03650 [Sediminicola sp. YIK13]
MKRISLLFSTVLLLAISCSDETTIYSEPESTIKLETNLQVLTSSIVFDNSGVLDIFEKDETTGKFSKSNAAGVAGDYPLTLVAQVSPPSFTGGTNLTASHVNVDGNFAYVSYNTVDASYAGAIDIINISDPNNPVVTSRMYFTNRDINALKYDSGFVYAIGGIEAEGDLTALSNSFVAKIPAVNGIFSATGIIFGYQEGFVATDVETTATNVYVTSGMDGVLAAYDKLTLTISISVLSPDLRSLAIQDNQIAVLDGSKGLSIFDQNFQLLKEIAINSDFGVSTKKTIDFDTDRIMVSEGSKGVGVYNITSGSLIEYIPILINPDGVDMSDIVNNAVAINEGVILMANGGAGLSLNEKKTDNTEEFGIIGLDGSINYVASKDDYVFAASGKLGLQILKMNKPSETLLNRCVDLLVYIGNDNLRSEVGEALEYSGGAGKRLKSVGIDGSLLLCGSWTVQNNTWISEGALFEMNGSYIIGSNKKQKEILVQKNGVFRVEGNLTIYGNLILEEGATMEFLDGSVVNIFGDVIMDPTAEVKGNFVDLQNKF